MNFPGFPAYLGRAAEELGYDPSLAAGAPPAALAAMANLCAQASTSGPGPAAAILGRAAALRDRLRVAARAAELMLDDVARATTPSPEAEPEARPRPARATGRAIHHRP
jgi:hypothetical protein